MTPTTEAGAFALRFLLDAGIAFGFKVVPDGAAKMIAAIEAEARAAALRDLRAALDDGIAVFADGDGHTTDYVEHQWRCTDDCPAHRWLEQARAALDTAKEAGG